jgi:carnitine O-acetyltransferase
MSTSQLSSLLFDGWGTTKVSSPPLSIIIILSDVTSHGWVWFSICPGLALYALGHQLRPAEMRHYLAKAATEVRDMMEAAKKADAETHGKGKAIS